MATGTDEWWEYQDDYTNRGYLTDGTSHFTSQIGVTYTDGNDGNEAQPLVLDIDSDGDADVITESGNYIKIYNSQMSLVDELSIGETFLSPPVSPNGTTFMFNTVSNNNWVKNYLYEYNGSRFKNICNLTYGIAYGASITQAGITCKGDYCYWLDGSTSQAGTKLNKIEWASCTNTSSFVINAEPVDYSTPAISDIDQDGSDEIVFLSDANGDGFDTGFSIYDTNGAGIPFLQTNIDGLGSNAVWNSPLIHNLEGGGGGGGGGYSEIIVSYIETGNLTIKAYDYLGAEQRTYSREQHQVSYPGGLTISDMGATNEYVCALGYSSGFVPRITCLDYEFGVIGEWNFGAVDGIAYPRGSMSSYDADGDGIDELVTSFGIINSDGNLLVETTGYAGYWFSIADVNGDEELELVGSNGTATRIIYSAYNNSVPVFNQFNYDTGNPVCNGTGNMTFYASESAEDYTNDNDEDTERINVTLPNGTSYVGAYHLSNPSVQVPVPAEVGTYTLSIYLQDDANDGDFSQRLDYTLITSSASLICNSIGESGGSSGVESDVAADGALDSSLETMWETIGLGKVGAAIMLLIAMVSVSGSIVLGMAKQQFDGGSIVAVVVAVNVLLMVMGVLLGMIDLWIPVTVVIGLIAIAVIQMYRGGGS